MLEVRRERERGGESLKRRKYRYMYMYMRSSVAMHINEEAGIVYKLWFKYLSSCYVSNWLQRGGTNGGREKGER